jgi:hypothetical protein
MIRQIYHHYQFWEDYQNGMWKGRIVLGEEREKLLKLAIEFTGDAKLYGSFMLRVAKEWKFACEHHLTNVGINRKAWIGHAACCLALGCPEDITREAWHHLSKRQQDKANLEADRAIDFWIREHRKKHRLCLNDQLELTY